MRYRDVHRSFSGVCIALLVSVFSAACAEGGGHQPDTPQLTGMLIEGGIECQLFQADDGAQYTLMGDLKGFQNGDKVQLSGEEVEVSFCMQGKTWSVKTISKVKP